MVSSEITIDSLVRRKRKMAKMAFIAAGLTSLFMIALVITNFRLANLNKIAIDEFTQKNSQIQMDAESLSTMKQSLASSKSEVELLNKKLAAEKSLNQALKNKLASTLKQMAQAHDSTQDESADVQTDTSTLQATEGSQEQLSPPATTDVSTASSVNSPPESTNNSKKTEKTDSVISGETKPLQPQHNASDTPSTNVTKEALTQNQENIQEKTNSSVPPIKEASKANMESPPVHSSEPKQVETDPSSGLQTNQASPEEPPKE